METKVISGNTYKKVSGGWQLVEQQPEKPKRTGAGELLPTAFAVGGGILGGIAGSLAGPAGTVGGGIAGAGAGGALGEAIQQGIEKRFGQREKISTPQIAATGVISGATQAIGGVVAKGLGAGAKLVANKTREPMVNFLKHVSGYNNEMINRALTRTPGVTTGIKGGETALSNLITTSAQKINKMAKDSVVESQSQLKKLTQMKLSEDSVFAKALSSSADKYKAARTEIFNKFGDFRNQVTTNLRQSHNIGVDKTGTLNFARQNQPSRIVSGAEQKAIQEAYNLASSLRNNLSLKHVNAIYEKLIVLKSKTPVGSPTGAEAKAAIGDIMDNVHAFIQRVYPKEYTQFLEQNMQKRIYINEARELFGSKANLSPKEKTIISNRLLQLFNTGRLPSREFAEKVGGDIGEDIVGTAAGTAIKTGGQVSMRAQELTRPGIIRQVVEFIPRKSLENYIKTGKISGEIAKNKFIISTAKTLKISVKALLQEAANLSANKTTQ